MKYPVLSRVVLYSAIAFLSGALLLCLFLMEQNPFNERDMRIAYVAGCQQASKPLTDLNIEKCSISGDIFQDNLKRIGEQMDAILEK